MKQIFLFFSFVLIFAIAPQSKVLAQNDCGDNARSYVNANISTNGIRAITGAKMNTALNKIIDAIICRDTLATILQDSVFVEIQEDSILSFTVFGQNFKDTIRITGGGGGTGWGLSGNSVGGFDYIGTNNLQDFRIKVNNVPQGLIDTDGDVYLYGIDTIDSFLEGVDYIMTWSPTGELRRISSDSIADITFRLTQNGLNYTGGNLELGGQLLHPTVIDINSNPLLLDAGGFYNYLTGGYTGVGAGYFSIPSIASIGAGITGHTVSTLAKHIGTNELRGEHMYSDQTQVGRYNGFINTYDATDLDISRWIYNNQPVGESIGITLNSNGFNLFTGHNGLAPNWTNANLFKIAHGGLDLFQVKTNGNINLRLNAYDDDTDAGANGLVQGDLYETSATNTLGLPAGVIMRKQ